MPFAVPTDLGEWAADIEFSGGFPQSDTNALVAWGAAEGGSFKNTGYANVLNTTLKEPGSTPINSVGVQSFAIPGDTQAQDWETGIQADLDTIDQSNMADIKTALAGGNASQTLPTALAKDPWGTNASTVAQLLGESPSDQQALATEQATSGGGGPNAQLASINANPFDLFGIPQTVLGGAASAGIGAIWNDVGPFIVKAILVITGLGIIALGLDKATGVGQKGKDDAQQAAPAAAAAAAA
jgi:hypothetical protein